MRRVSLFVTLIVLVSACAGTEAEPSTTTAEAATTSTFAPATTTSQVTTTTAETTTTTMDPALEPLVGQWYILRDVYHQGQLQYWQHSVVEFKEHGYVATAGAPRRALVSPIHGRFILDGEFLELTFVSPYPNCSRDATYRLIWESEDRITLEAVDDTCAARIAQYGRTFDRRTEEALQDLRERNVGTQWEWTD